MKLSKVRITLLVIIEMLIFLLSLVGVSYAYYTVTANNEFNTTAINALTNSVGSVSLINVNSLLSLDLTNADMVNQSNEVYYYATPTGKSTTATSTEIARAIVSPSDDTNYYECDYSLSITHSGANDMYDYYHDTYVKSLENGSEGEMMFNINSNRYDWYTNGMPSSYANTFLVTAQNSYSIMAGFKIQNIPNVKQSALAGTDISITIRGTSLSCRVVEPTITYYNAQDSTPLTSPRDMAYYMKKASSGDASLYETCGVFNKTTVCMTPYASESMSDYYDTFTDLGLTCNSTYVDDGYLECNLDNLGCTIREDIVSCGYGYTSTIGGSECNISKTGDNDCVAWK